MVFVELYRRRKFEGAERGAGCEGAEGGAGRRGTTRCYVVSASISRRCRKSSSSWKGFPR